MSSSSFPSNVRKAIAEGVAQLEKAIREPKTKDLICELVHSYSTLDRTSLLAKISYFTESLIELCGPEGAGLVANVLTRGSSRGSWEITNEVKNDNVQQFLKDLVSKYGTKYQWMMEPFQNDWQRYNISTKYIGVPPMPVISLEIFSKSGERLELESPIGNYADLLLALVKHLGMINEEMEKYGQAQAVQKRVTRAKLQEMKKVLEKLLEEPKK